MYEGQPEFGGFSAIAAAALAEEIALTGYNVRVIERRKHLGKFRVYVCAPSGIKKLQVRKAGGEILWPEIPEGWRTEHVLCGLMFSHREGLYERALALFRDESCVIESDVAEPMLKAG